MGTDFIKHPGFGSFGQHDDTCSDRGINPSSGTWHDGIQTCRQCKKRFMTVDITVKKLVNCKQHEGFDPVDSAVKITKGKGQ